jgi:hypothetical protein
MPDTPEVIAQAGPKRQRINRPNVPRHELPYWRKCDIAMGLNISDSSAYRLRQLPGFPEPNALGLYSRDKVLAFVAALQPKARAASATTVRSERGRFAKRDDCCAADMPSAEARAVERDGDGRIPARTTKTASPEAMQSDETSAGSAAQPRATRHAAGRNEKK